MNKGDKDQVSVKARKRSKADKKAKGKRNKSKKETWEPITVALEDGESIDRSRNESEVKRRSHYEITKDGNIVYTTPFWISAVANMQTFDVASSVLETLFKVKYFYKYEDLRDGLPQFPVAELDEFCTDTEQDSSVLRFRGRKVYEWKLRKLPPARFLEINPLKLSKFFKNQLGVNKVVEISIRWDPSSKYTMVEALMYINFPMNNNFHNFPFDKHDVLFFLDLNESFVDLSEHANIRAELQETGLLEEATTTSYFTCKWAVQSMRNSEENRELFTKCFPKVVTLEDTEFFSLGLMRRTQIGLYNLTAFIEDGFQSGPLTFGVTFANTSNYFFVSYVLPIFFYCHDGTAVAASELRSGESDKGRALHRPILWGSWGCSC